MHVFKKFSIEAAHWLPNVPADHKCRRLHGHSFHIEIRVSGDVDKHLGWVIDFAEIKDAFAPIYDSLDHRCLNDIEGLENPTCENLAFWIWNKMSKAIPMAIEVTVHETCTAGCTYSGTTYGEPAKS